MRQHRNTKESLPEADSLLGDVYSDMARQSAASPSFSMPPGPISGSSSS